MTPHIQAEGLTQDDEEHLNRIKLRFDSAKIISVKGKVCGLLKLVEEGDEWDLIQIQIDTHFRGKGIGQRVIKDVLKRAFASGASVKLSVLRSNPAKKLYEKLGFKPYMQTDTTFEMRAVVSSPPGFE
ncbi:hypothetical protein GCM10009092_21840 [Bowmanella denitrificans]|uniref:N-acetyltransferase domain-containing protein n=2 Tax=Bowmanella denitrificans TaxID=366582 RepID=A0ABN0X7N1_9ALTE